jgi:hypothetical protein
MGQCSRNVIRPERGGSLALAARPTTVQLMATRDSRRPLFAALSTLAITVGVIGWVPLVLSAGLAMGSAPDSQIAIALGLAGLAAVLGLSLGGLGLARGKHLAIDIAAALAVAISGLLAVVALVFAFSFRW